MSKREEHTFAAAFDRVRQERPVPRPQGRSEPTHAQVVVAAWGNVAAENPKVTLGDAKRAIKKA